MPLDNGSCQKRFDLIHDCDEAVNSLESYLKYRYRYFFGIMVSTLQQPELQTSTAYAVAASLNIAIRFARSSSSGAVKDNVVVSAVQEPETYAMLLAGLGVVKFAARGCHAANR